MSGMILAPGPMRESGLTYDGDDDTGLIAPGSLVNGKVMLDGPGDLWVTSVAAGDGEGTFYLI